MAIAQTSHRSPAPEPVAAPTSLDELARLSEDALAGLYAAGRCPAVPELTGAHRGRLLAWHGAPGPVAAGIRALARSPLFPWTGKSFQHRDGAFGRGDNRIFGGRHGLAAFETRAGISRAGDFDAVQLDYDRPGNPPGLRRVVDELREIGPGLWLGQAWLRLGADGPARLVLWFGLERS